MLHLDRHHLDRDDGVVDQQTQRQDERAQRDLVQTDIERRHKEKRYCQHQRNRHHDDQTGTQPQAHQTNRQYNQHRLAERAQKLIDRALYGTGHAGYVFDLDADR